MRRGRERAAKYTSDASLLYMRENMNTVTRRFPVLNWIVSFFFFFFLIMRRVANCLEPSQNVAGHLSGELTANDICYFVSTLTFEATNDREMMLGVIVISTAVLLSYLVAILMYALPIYASGFTLEVNVLMWHYVLPFCAVLGANLFVRTYQEMEVVGIHPLHYAALIVNGVMLVGVALTMVGNSDSVLIVNHVFYHRDTASALVCMTYYFLTVQSYGILETYLVFDVFSVCCGLVMCLFVVFYSPYYHRVMNVFLFITASFMTFASVGRLADNTLHAKAIYTVFLSVGLSIIVFYVLIPCCYSKCAKGNQFFVYFLCGMRHRAKQEIESIDMNRVPQRYWRVLLVLANELEVDRLDEFIRIFREAHGDVKDSKFFWMYTNYVYSHNGWISETYVDLKLQAEREVCEIENEFWKAAWASEITRLPSIAGDLGRLSMRMRMNMMFFTRKYQLHGYFGPPEVPHSEMDAKDLIMEILTVLVGLFVIAGHILLLVVLLQHQSVYKAIGLLNKFQSAFYEFHSRVIRGQFTGITPYYFTMVDQFNKLNNAEFQGMIDLIDEQNLSASFIAYAQYLNTTSSFDMELFVHFVESYNTVLGNLGWVFKEKSRDKASIYQYYVNLVSLVAPIAGILAILSLLVGRRIRIRRFAMTFPTIDKRILERVGSFDNKQRLLDTFKVDRRFSAVRAFPLSFVYDVMLWFLCCLFVGSLMDAKASVRSDTDMFIFITDAYENLQRIPVWLMSALFASHFSRNEYFWKCLADSHFLTSQLLSDTRLSEVISKFPDDYYDLCGYAVYNEIPSLDDERTLTVIETVLQSSTAIEESQPFSTVLYWQRFFSHLVSFFLIALVFAIVGIRLKPMSLSEQRMSELLLQRLRQEYVDDTPLEEFSSSSETESVLDTSFNRTDVPLVLFVINDRMLVTYETNAARELLQVDLNRPISEAQLEMTTRSQLASEIQKYQQFHSTEPVSIPFGNQNHSLLITPYYSYHLDLVLQYVVVVKLDEPPNETEEMEKRINRSFYSVYPTFVPLETELPCLVRAKTKASMIIIMKLIGFNAWANTVALEVVQKFRSEINDRFHQVMDSSFVQIRDTGDTFVFMVNRDDAKLTVWVLNERCGLFGEQLLAEQKAVCEKYEARDVSGLVLLVRTKDQNYYLPARPMGRVDFQGEACIQDIEQCLPFCKTDIVNLTTFKLENKMKNVTKVRVCRKPDGTPYDLFIVV